MSSVYEERRISCFNSAVRSSPNTWFLPLGPFTNGTSEGNSCRAPSGYDKTVLNAHTLHVNVKREVITYILITGCLFMD
jgi:hypothetical protein